MKVIVTDNYDEMSAVGVGIVKDVMINNPACVMGFATGSSPIGLYEGLAECCKRGEISFKQVKAVNLDEYVGIGADHEQSYAYFMSTQLFNKVDIDRTNTFIPNGLAEVLSDECKRYSRLLAGLPRDIQILGLGSNGHIGFNEPGTDFDSLTHVVELTDNTISDNSRLFKSIEEVPRRAITMGIKEIMASKAILVLASGKNKCRAVYEAVKGAVDPSWPASVLKNHDNVVIVADKEAAMLL